MKSLLKWIIRYSTSLAPWGVREAMLDGCLSQDRGILDAYLDRLSFPERYSRLLPKCNLVEIAASGDRGIVASLSTDTGVISEYAGTGTFAEAITATLSKFFHPNGGTYIDIGANIGLMTIPLARNPLIQCIAFEPEPVNFDLLKRNIMRNAPNSSVELHQTALYHSRSSLELAIAVGNIGDHRLTTSGVPGRQTITVTTQPLDEFLDRITGPLAVKIDTQGAEPYIIAGGQQVLARSDLLVMEFCPYLIRQLKGDPELPIGLVTGFERVAVMSAGVAAPTYTDPLAAAGALRAKLATAADTDSDYVDIIAMRRTAIERR